MRLPSGYQPATFGNHQTVVVGSPLTVSLVYFSSYLSFFAFLYIFIYFRLHSILFSEFMIKKTRNSFVSNSHLYDSWIRVIFAKVLMLSVNGTYTCALRASLLATWIYSEYWVKPLSFPLIFVRKSHKNNKNLSLLSIRHSPSHPLHRSFLVHC